MDGLQTLFKDPIIKALPITGGDIADAQMVTTSKGDYFVKSSRHLNAKTMFMAEAASLAQIGKTNTIAVPKVLNLAQGRDRYFLVLQHLKSKNPTAADFEVLGRQLAQLHLAPTPAYFGFEKDNFIGSLPQTNTPHTSWEDFYVQERLLPQLKLAFDNQLLALTATGLEERISTRCQSIFGPIQPSLLHGDLWNGNFLIDTNGRPYLIDPTAYYGHNEVDLAMTKLFGGFSPSFYGAYAEILPPHPKEKELVDIYQLYYLLVHLNLFGKAYYKPVQSIITRYF